MLKFLQKNALYISFSIALISTLGSLIFSEILHFPPCTLCWYQRSMMYPLVPILLVGILKKDKHISNYVLPLSVIGLLIGFYHNLLYYNILPESQAPCALGVSCTTKFIEWFGFITIPLLSFSSFAIITFLMLLHRKAIKK